MNSSDMGHSSVLEISLSAVEFNLNTYKNYLPDSAKIMVMVKADGYGCGAETIARYLSKGQIDYLGVAFIEEGIALREAGIELPIMVMIPRTSQFPDFVKYQLEPELFSLPLIEAFCLFAKAHLDAPYPVHIKLDTGMNRLGLAKSELTKIKPLIKDCPVEIISLLSHLAVSGNPTHDSFTQQQIAEFETMAAELSSYFRHTPTHHILNSGGIERFHSHPFDMTRLGIGLYGLSTYPGIELKEIAQWNSYLAQVRYVKQGETVGYNRSGKVNAGSWIGIVPVGYADGFRRSLGNGNWHVEINGQMYPTIGDVCMDMIMVDLGNQQREPGDHVVIMSMKNSAIDMANQLDTIPYEVITSIAKRVKRIYVH